MGRGVVLEYELLNFIDNFDSIQPERGLFMPCYNVVHTYIYIHITYIHTYTHTYIDTYIRHTECMELEHGLWIDIVYVIGCKILFLISISI